MITEQLRTVFFTENNKRWIYTKRRQAEQTPLCFVSLGPSPSGASSCHGCAQVGSITIEGPLRRRTLLKEGRKPRVHGITFIVSSIIDLDRKAMYLARQVEGTRLKVPSYILYHQV